MVVTTDVQLNGVDVDDFTVTGGATLTHRGIIDGDVEVSDGLFELYGIQSGALKISERGRAVVYGVAKLRDASLSAPVEVFGVVEVNPELVGMLAARPGCIINGVKH